MQRSGLMHELCMCGTDPKQNSKGFENAPRRARSHTGPLMELKQNLLRAPPPIPSRVGNTGKALKTKLTSNSQPTKDGLPHAV